MSSGLIKSTNGQSELSIDSNGKLSAASFTNDSGTFTLSPNGNDGVKLEIKSSSLTKEIYFRYNGDGVVISPHPTDTDKGIRIGSDSVDIL